MATYSNPAEIQRGLVWDLDLQDPQGIQELRGTITGAIQFNRWKGAAFDGANDKITFSTPALWAGPGGASLVAEFTPTVAPDENHDRFLFVDAASNYIWKRNTAAGLTLQILVRGTYTFVIPYASYSPYWLTNQRNCLVIAMRSGRQYFWLNGVEVFTDTQAMTFTGDFTTLNVGCNTVATTWLGWIKSLKFFNHPTAADVLTAQEAQDFYLNRAYNYQARATCILPMGAEQHEPGHTQQAYEVSQAELLVDGSMEAVGIAAWTVLGAGAVVQKAPGSRPGGTGVQVLQVIRAGAQAIAYQTIMTVGQRYRVTGWARGDGTAWPRVGSGASFYWTGTTSTTWQYFDIVFTTSNALLCLYNNTVDGTVEFDDVTTIQSVEWLSDGSMETGDVDQWSAGNSAVLTKSLVNPQAGTRSLQVTYGGIASPYAAQFTLTVARQYNVSGYARGDGTAVPSVQDGAVVLWTGTSSTAWQQFNVTFTATTTGLRLQSSAVAAGNCGFDTVALREIRPRTLDASGRGNHFALGNGTTPATLPTRRVARGYDLNGSQYLVHAATFTLTDFTVVLANVRADEGTTRHFCCFLRDDAATQALAIGLSSSTGPNVAIMHNNGGSSINTGIPMGLGNEILVWAFTAATRVSNIYLNGTWRYTSAAATLPNGYNGGVWLGAAGGGGSGSLGSQKYFALFPFCVTALQAADISGQILREIGAV